MSHERLIIPSANLASAAPMSAPNAGARKLHKAFWVTVAAITAVIGGTAHVQNVESGIGAVCIGAAALLPTWLWITGRVKGLPLFPVFSTTYVYAFAFPLLYEHPIVAMFQPDVQLIGAFTVTGFLLLGTAVWYQVGRRAPKPIRRCLVLNAANADLFLMVALGAGAAFNMAGSGGWLNLQPGLNSIIRASALALQALAAFALSFRLGTGELSPPKKVVFRFLISLLMLSTLPGLLLVNAMSICVIAAFGYTLGAHRFPWRIGLAAMLLFAFLHAGKGAMREIHWKVDEDPTFQPADYPAFISQWAQISATNWFGGETESEEHQSLIQRASLMQLLLYVQTMTGDAVPYLDGQTYAILPTLLVPRIFTPEKIASHEGTYLLNIHYGFQLREDTARTTIGFGLLNEAYANFGLVGVGGLAVVLGAYYALVARWARGSPVLSFRSLFAAIVASYSFQSEYASGVYVAALFQSTIALCAVAVLFIRRGDCSGDGRSVLE